ncbi:MAG: ribosome silencing factor [Anaerolineae bacterium]
MAGRRLRSPPPYDILWAHRRSQEATLEALELARYIVDTLAGKMGADILLLDMQEVTLITDYFVIATAASERQIGALSSDVVEQTKRECDTAPMSVEGTPAGGWVLLDYGSVVVHLFSEEQRAHYQLEELWEKARTVLRIA